MPQTVSIPIFDGGPFFMQMGDRVVYYYPIVVEWLRDFINIVIAISIPLSVFFLIGIIYSVQRLKQIKIKDNEKYDLLPVEPGFEDTAGGGTKSLADRWQKVSSLLASDNQNDWKQAILEADVMLDEILNGLGYKGESIGEKLKRVQVGEFRSIQEAWDAHKVRNQIAHDGAGFHLSKHEANQTIQKYRTVFEEFYYI